MKVLSGKFENYVIYQKFHSAWLYLAKTWNGGPEYYYLFLYWDDFVNSCFWSKLKIEKKNRKSRRKGSNCKLGQASSGFSLLIMASIQRTVMN